MAAKKKSASKQVTVTIDQDTLINLVNALKSLSDSANALSMGVDDPAVRSKLLGGAQAKKKAAKKRT